MLSDYKIILNIILDNDINEQLLMKIKEKEKQNFSNLYSNIISDFHSNSGEIIEYINSFYLNDYNYQYKKR